MTIKMNMDEHQCFS